MNTGLRAENIESRHYAGVLDEPLDAPPGGEDVRGCNPSPEAIGGYYGISWYQFYRDAETGEVYRVRCSDGVNGGKGAYALEDEEWRQQCYRAILVRIKQEALGGVSEIHVSRHEWHILKGFGEDAWRRHSRGALVIVDLAKPNCLPPRRI